jgi:hypothetical protein
MAPPTPSLEGISTELLQLIMCNLPAEALLFLVPTSKTIHRRFKASEKFIINECIKREIEPELRFEAFVVSPLTSNSFNHTRYTPLIKMYANYCFSHRIIRLTQVVLLWRAKYIYKNLSTNTCRPVTRLWKLLICDKPLG